MTQTTKTQEQQLSERDAQIKDLRDALRMAKNNLEIFGVGARKTQKAWDGKSLMKIIDEALASTAPVSDDGDMEARQRRINRARQGTPKLSEMLDE